MQRFQFRLERVLEWQRKKLQIEESRLAACLELVQIVEGKIAWLQADRSAIEADLLQRSAIPAADFLNLGRYRIRADKEELELAAERRQRLASADEQRARVLHAQRRVKLLEKLRERRRAEHAALEARELESVAAAAYLARWSQAQQRDRA
jgi:flagellar export protein FliJ